VSRYRVAIDLDEAALVGRCLAYVADPRPDRGRHGELFRLLAVLGRYGLGPPAELLDALAVDGGTRREDVAAVVSAWLAQATAEDEAEEEAGDGAGALGGGGGATGGASPFGPPARPARGAAVLPAVRVAAGPTPAGAERLTARETDVLRLVAGGRTNLEIAGALGLSPHTVKRHVHRILTKLALPSRAAAAAFALQTGVV
jgi:DNA-binding CsgD family transcriptional regulator